MISPDTQILIACQLGGIVFYAGIHVATSRGHGKTLKSHSRKLEKVDGDLQVHDREIGNVYGRMRWPREVRR